MNPAKAMRPKDGSTLCRLRPSARLGTSTQLQRIDAIRYLVEELGLSLTDRDNFGSQPLHWAALHGHLDTVRWISEYTKYPAARANWAKAFEKVRRWTQ